MPQKKASIKDVRRIKKNSARNSLVLRNIKELIKDAQKALAAGDTAKAQEFYGKLQQAVDKAVKAKVLKGNNANRKKARLSKKITASKKK
ncbi:MAG: 30S ribosomal protein S20 [Candidatus Komeilibacteria bacterium]